MSVQLVIDTFRWLLQPIAPFTWIGYDISTLDLVAALRLCVVMRQLREMMLKSYVKKQRAMGVKGVVVVEPRSLVKEMVSTLVVVYGGEALVCPWLQLTPSFLYSPVVPALYSALQAMVEYAPWIPEMSLYTEFPLSIFDGFSRSFLLCQLIPPTVLALGKTDLASSPWTLLLSSLFIANTGFFMVNTFSMLQPTGYGVITPPELLPNGWTTIDLWCAPFITGLYALLTHAQPFWVDLHTLIVSWTSGAMEAGIKDVDIEMGIPENMKITPVHAVAALDPESARAVCAMILMTMFLARTVRNFGGDLFKPKKAVGVRYGLNEKTKTQ